MRIIAGEWRGRTIYAPKGDKTRPTVDRVRESLMSSLNSILGGFEDEIVLDAFAGSGALGLECLSRGAAYAQFHEQDQQAIKAIQRNFECVGSPSNAVLRRGDVFAHVPHGPQPFSLVLLDPPYAVDYQQVFDLLDAMAASGCLADDAVVSYEHAKNKSLDEAMGASAVQWEPVTSKHYGETAIDIFKRGEA